MAEMTQLKAVELRKMFGRGEQNMLQMPGLNAIQKQSYDHFLQINTPPEKRENSGLHGVFKSVFPISDFTQRAQLDFIDYVLEDPKYDIEECRHRGLTYETSIRCKLQLIVFDIDEDSQAKSIKDIKEQYVYIGDIPLMTDNGTFIINGAERVVVSQMHRSPGVFFDHDRGKTHDSGKLLFSSRIIPYRGSWLDFEFDIKDILYARIDRRRKIPATIILRALDYSAKEILHQFYDIISYQKDGEFWRTPCEAQNLRGLSFDYDLINASNGEVLIPANVKITGRMIKEIEEKKVKHLRHPIEALEDRFLADELVDKKSGEIIGIAGAQITKDMLEQILSSAQKDIPTLAIDYLNSGPYIRNTLLMDKCDNREEALHEIYRVMRPGDPPTTDTASILFEQMFFDSSRYDLSPVGRVNINRKFKLKTSDDQCVLTKEDIVEIIRKLVDLRSGRGDVDDIDNLGNRRVRSVGELVENQYRIGLVRMERAIKERMSSIEIDNIAPQSLINSKPIMAVVREFFGSSQLSQFMDQTNPLSEITHKRRLSALGPGGLTRERAGFEVRDVHPTHYGRICPIETPEGPNIGLINSLSTYARINKYGLIETPYLRVEKGTVTKNIDYLSAIDEVNHYIAQADTPTDDKGKISEETINCRVNGEFELVAPEQVNYMDISPKQIVSIAAALIPFLENDDANRALMGSNMQRQAVPLMCTSAPLVGTGMEAVVARDSGSALVAKRSGVVDQVDAKRIFIRADNVQDSSDSGVDIYTLRKFQRSNQNSCINQRPLVYAGQKVKEGDIIADGHATDNGELALGRNVLVAFMPWNGYNFEDSILISERLVREDVFTSIHIEAFEVMARDTKLGPEEITRDVPNVGEEALSNLDEAGIAYIGAQVNAGDILVGKTTPKSESPMTAEEKLLRAIFGEKASEVRDSSLRLPPGFSGTVVDVRVFNRHGIEKDERALIIEQAEIERLTRDRDDEKAVLKRNIYGRLKQILLGQKLASYSDKTLGDKDKDKSALLSKGALISEEIFEALPQSQWWNLVPQNNKVLDETQRLHESFKKGEGLLDKRFHMKSEKARAGLDLPPGVMKTVKVFVAVKRKIQRGDKVAGRHGNKGVISKIMPIEDMPHLDDGTIIDVVLNPLGVPSRMNVGQILETHMGWACAGMGKRIGEALESWRREKKHEDLKKTLGDIYGEDSPLLKKPEKELVQIAEHLKIGVPIATPVFEGAKEDNISKLLEDSGLDSSGQVILYDGRTGKAFERPVTIGFIYILKLHHLVDEKIHARSVGPYSLVTQQPLGGKAKFGGQRFGEMEVWALEAYGAGYTLQEMLTIKSDDVAGRTKAYEAIVQGEDGFTAGVPESFNVLVMEMRSLGLNIDLAQDKD